MARDTRQDLSSRYEARPQRAEIDYWRSLPAAQQPDWGDDWLIDKIRTDLAALPPLVEWDDVRRLRELLADVAAGELQVIQAGDCAEDPAECVPDVLSRKLGLLDSLAGVMRLRTGKPVIRVGRIAGQFAKPRSRATERYGEVDLPAFRGLLVNSPEPDPSARRADPLRMLACHQAAGTAMEFLYGLDSRVLSGEPAVWTSHEALVLDYEVPQLRRDDDGSALLTSTHWPWIGERTRDLEGAHVNLLAAVGNPVACKVGPTMTAGELLALCERLDPKREPGRLTLIARLGAGVVAERLPVLVAAVRAAGYPVIWMCDPMHANTVTAPGGRKTRLVSTLTREIQDFQAAVAGAGGVAGGLHLETTPYAVGECVHDESDLHRVAEGRYMTLCDPRLNPEQALTVVSCWGP